MKITKTQLKQIIKEEIDKILKENEEYRTEPLTDDDIPALLDIIKQGGFTHNFAINQKLGFPPMSVYSMETGEWIQSLIDAGKANLSKGDYGWVLATE